MKKTILTFAVLLGICFAAQSQNLVADEFYERHADNERSLTIDLSGSFLNFFSGLFEDEDQDEFEKAIQDLTRLKVVSVEKNEVSQVEVEALKRAFLRDRLEEYAIIQEGRKKNYVMAKGDEVITEVAILAFGEEKFSLIYFEGRLDPETLGKMLDNDGLQINTDKKEEN